MAIHLETCPKTNQLCHHAALVIHRRSYVTIKTRKYGVKVVYDDDLLCSDLGVMASTLPACPRDIEKMTPEDQGIAIAALPPEARRWYLRRHYKLAHTGKKKSKKQRKHRKPKRKQTRTSPKPKKCRNK